MMAPKSLMVAGNDQVLPRMELRLPPDGVMSIEDGFKISCGFKMASRCRYLGFWTAYLFQEVGR